MSGPTCCTRVTHWNTCGAPYLDVEFVSPSVTVVPKKDTDIIFRSFLFALLKGWTKFGYSAIIIAYLSEPSRDFTPVILLCCGLSFEENLSKSLPNLIYRRVRKFAGKKKRQLD
jgi:hypothetical protein